MNPLNADQPAIIRDHLSDHAAIRALEAQFHVPLQFTARLFNIMGDGEPYEIAEWEIHLAGMGAGAPLAVGETRTQAIQYLVENVADYLATSPAERASSYNLRALHGYVRIPEEAAGA